MFAEVVLRKSQFNIHTILSSFSGVCIVAAFSLLFCVQAVTTHDCFEIDSTYISGSFNDDIAPMCRSIRENDFSVSNDLASDGNSAEYLPLESLIDLQFSFANRKNQAIRFYSDFSCEFIACAVPPRASPVSF